MDLVAFITTESGKDLIVSYAVVDAEDPTDIETLTLLRTPVYEGLLAEDERGVRVSFERFISDEDDLLEKVTWNEKTSILELETQHRKYELDLRKLDKKSLSRMCKILKKMNYDRRVEMSGV